MDFGTLVCPPGKGCIHLHKLRVGIIGDLIMVLVFGVGHDETHAQGFVVGGVFLRDSTLVVPIYLTS